MGGGLDARARKKMDSFPITEVTVYFFCLPIGDK